MSDNSRQQARESLLADLASARADLIEILKDAIRKVLAAQSALAIAYMAGFAPDTVCESGDGVAPLTVAELAELVKQCESEESRIRELLAQVDERFAQISPPAQGEVH